jgi:hypothetical protein
MIFSRLFRLNIYRCRHHQYKRAETKVAQASTNQTTIDNSNLFAENYDVVTFPDNLVIEKCVYTAYTTYTKPNKYAKPTINLWLVKKKIGRKKIEFASKNK